MNLYLALVVIILPLRAARKFISVGHSATQVRKSVQNILFSNIFSKTS